MPKVFDIPGNEELSTKVNISVGSAGQISFTYERFPDRLTVLVFSLREAVEFREKLNFLIDEELRNLLRGRPNNG